MQCDVKKRSDSRNGWMYAKQMGRHMVGFVLDSPLDPLPLYWALD